MRRSALAAAAALLAGLVGGFSAAAPASGYRLVREVPGGDGKYDYVSYDAALRRLFVGRYDGVMAYDLDSGRVTDRFVSGRWVHAPVVVPGTGRVVATSGDEGQAVVFNAADGKVLARIPVGSEPDGAVFEPVTGQVLVMNAGSGDVTFVDPVKLKGSPPLAVGPELEFAAADGQGAVFANVSGKAEIARIDARARKVTRRLALPGCEAPTALAYLKARDQLVATCANHLGLVLSAGEGRVVARLPLGGSPDAVIVDEARGRMFIPCGDEGALRVFSIAGREPPRLLQIVRTRPNARTGALDPVTGRIYLPRADLDPPDAQGSRAAWPGTFRLLVVEPATAAAGQS